MTTRNDVKVDFLEDPRIIEVEAPSVEITMQDLVDTLRKQEDAFIGMPFAKLTNASGKEDLGGGVSVGITVDLQNSQVSFEPRTTPAETGTVTTGSGTPVNSPLGPVFNFVDTNADFISAGIERGSLAVNFTDMSIADVIEVVSATELRTRVLSNGSDNSWQIGDEYHVFNIIQCDVSGGNLVAQDEDSNRISPVFPTAFNQIVRTASSSATLQEQADIQYASFNGGVSVNLSSMYSGTTYPTGTPRQPVNNFTDALAIAEVRGFTTFFVLGDATIDLGLDYTGYSFIGESKNKTTFTISPAANVTNAEFTNASVEGTLDGGNVLYECSLKTINYVDGFVEQCILNETITLSGAGDAHFLDCFSGVPGLLTPTIDMGGAGTPLAVRNYNGGLTISNKTGSDQVSIDLNSGQIIIDDTVTSGILVLRGVGRWTNKDTYAGGATIIDQLLKVDDVEQNSYDSCVTVDVVNGSSGITYPIGTPTEPVDNLADAKLISDARKFNKICFIGDLTLDSENWDSFIFEGENDRRSTLTVQTGVSTEGIEINECEVTGVIDGMAIQIKNCTTNDLTMNYGDIHVSGIRGDLIFTGAMTEQVRIVNCYGAGNPVTDRPTIDLGGNGPLVSGVRYTGDMLLTNKTGGGLFAMNLHGGRVELENTVTGGVILVSGVGIFTDNSSGATVQSSMLTSDIGIINELNSTLYDGVSFEDALTKLLSMATGRIVESSSGVFQFYEQDNSTVSFTLTKSGNERNRS